MKNDRENYTTIRIMVTVDIEDEEHKDDEEEFAFGC
ncbi:Hypothetical protein PHPALM_14114 [Phytophthora palmivora]|uniref:Uncharacterized protein n=1 Tax=Phytophthora palmivora TaxID=4796 RepID=A0A2P4XVJ8_9STRA|nr:Hypothetical protein PHPALM_14114 [Phytophthora palmivora]